MIVGLLVAALGAQVCPPLVNLAGGAALEVAEQLHGRGVLIGKTVEGCAAIVVTAEAEEATVLVSKARHGQLPLVRRVSNVRIAARLIESWARADLSLLSMLAVELETRPADSKRGPAQPRGTKHERSRRRSTPVKSAALGDATPAIPRRPQATAGSSASGADVEAPSVAVSTVEAAAGQTSATRISSEPTGAAGARAASNRTTPRVAERSAPGDRPRLLRDLVSGAADSPTTQPGMPGAERQATNVAPPATKPRTPKTAGAAATSPAAGGGSSETAAAAVMLPATDGSSSETAASTAMSPAAGGGSSETAAAAVMLPATDGSSSETAASTAISPAAERGSSETAASTAMSPAVERGSSETAGARATSPAARDHRPALEAPSTAAPGDAPKPAPIPTVGGLTGPAAVAVVGDDVVVGTSPVLVSARAEAALADDGSPWFGGALTLGWRLGPVTPQLLARVSRSLARASDALAADSQHLGVDLLLGAELELDVGPVVLRPGLGVGAGWLQGERVVNQACEATSEPCDHDGVAIVPDQFVSTEWRPRAEAALVASIALGAGASLQLALSATFSPFAPSEGPVPEYAAGGDETIAQRLALAKEPLVWARLGLGLVWEGP